MILNQNTKKIKFNLITSFVILLLFNGCKSNPFIENHRYFEKDVYSEMGLRELYEVPVYSDLDSSKQYWMKVYVDSINNQYNVVLVNDLRGGVYPIVSPDLDKDSIIEIKEGNQLKYDTIRLLGLRYESREFSFNYVKKWVINYLPGQEMNAACDSNCNFTILTLEKSPSEQNSIMVYKAWKIVDFELTPMDCYTIYRKGNFVYCE